MNYRKFQADSLFTGEEFLDEQKVLITTSEGVIVDVIDKQQAGDDIQKLHGTLSPGFVNAHCHLELSHMLGKIPPGTGLVDFLITVIRQRSASQDEILEAMQQADRTMFENGISAVGDICNMPFSIPVKMNSPIRWRNFIEVLGFTEINAQARLDDGAKTLGVFHSAGDAIGLSSLTPHAPYSVSPALFRLIDSSSAGLLVSIHNQESAAEQDLFEKGNGGMFRLYENLGIDPSFFKAPGRSSLESYLPMLADASGVMLVHNTYSTAEDISFAISQRGTNEVFFCVCAQANNYIEKAMPPVALLRKNDATIVLGTDSLASNNNLDILEEIKLISREYPEVPVGEILQWATFNGALALEMRSQFGSFAKGKQPGIILLEGVDEKEISHEARVKRIL